MIELITRRELFKLLFGAGMWVTIARWFKGEPRPMNLEPYQLEAFRCWSNRHFRLSTRYPISFISDPFPRRWETFKYSREEMERLADCWRTDVRVNYPCKDEWDNLQPAEEDVRRIRRLLVEAE